MGCALSSSAVSRPSSEPSQQNEEQNAFEAAPKELAHRMFPVRSSEPTQPETGKALTARLEPARLEPEPEPAPLEPVCRSASNKPVVVGARVQVQGQAPW